MSHYRRRIENIFRFPFYITNDWTIENSCTIRNQYRIHLIGLYKWSKCPIFLSCSTLRLIITCKKNDCYKKASKQSHKKLLFVQNKLKVREHKILKILQII